MVAAVRTPFPAEARRISRPRRSRRLTQRTAPVGALRQADEHGPGRRRVAGPAVRHPGEGGRAAGLDEVGVDPAERAVERCGDRRGGLLGPEALGGPLAVEGGRHDRGADRDRDDRHRHEREDEAQPDQPERPASDGEVPFDGVGG